MVAPAADLLFQRLAVAETEMKIDPTIVSVVSAAIAAVSVAIAFYNYRVASRNSSREQLNQKIEAAKWRREYFSDLVKWSDESMLLLSEALHLCDLDPQKCETGKFFDSRHALRIKLSAQIDKGRWFFPNYAVDQHEQHKEAAFRGYRLAVLDGLVFTYRAVTSLDYVNGANKTAARVQIEQGKKLFTSEIQQILDPRTRDEEFRKLTGRVEGA